MTLSSRPRSLCASALPLLSLAAAALFAAPAPAAVIHQVAGGESLWSVAASDGISEAALARANGLDPATEVQAGARLVIPAGGAAGVAGVSSPAPAPAPAAGVAPVAGGDADADVDDAGAAAQTPVAPAVTPVVTGTASATGSLPVAASGSVTSGQIGQVAAAHGVPPSLAQAVAYQESGFNNGVVSSANARGVMQIIPSTWNFIQSQLSPGRLDPFSPLGNVHAGVLYLSYLLRHSGSESAAVASYYQGLRSVTRSGPLPETRNYVNNVLALRRRFGG